ncbi:MAG: glucose-6-phosphate isomerase [Phycisphaera sp.]|nr:glucose-6-phosphate isomerase [Phycisphaera sp.]
MSGQSLWQRYQDHLCVCPSIGLTLDISRIGFGDGFFGGMSGAMGKAYEEMDALESGAIANPDEQRMVGHYWLRNASLAPSDDIRGEIVDTLGRIKLFAKDIHSGAITAPGGGRFTDILVIGIGGSALGPQFVADALGDPDTDKMTPHFFDNTDPDGIDRTLRAIGDRLKSTLAIVISKSGGTPETRNGMLLAQAAYDAAGLNFAQYAVAVTGVDSKLDKVAEAQGWLLRLPMWDWVGGRTSELAAVGLLPAALQGLDVDAMLHGAAACDAITRKHDTAANPAALLALMWHHVTNGRGEKDMVVLPYKDRLLLFSRYLQQLVMESLGKEKDLAGNVVHQGIAVYGNKGSTDQHAYVQQLREGVNNFFAVFIRVMEDGGRMAGETEVESGVTPGDYLDGFWQGTRRALFENGRGSITLTVPRVDGFHVGVLIALFERAVGFYASLVGINAYHQPGVEAGKKAAAAVLDLQAKVVAQLMKSGVQTVEQIAEAIGAADDVETVYHVLEHMVANGRANAARGDGQFDATYAV